MLSDELRRSGFAEFRKGKNVIYQKVTVYTEETESVSAALILLGAEGTEVISPCDDDLRCFLYDYVELHPAERSSVAAYFPQEADTARIRAELNTLGYLDLQLSEVNSEDWEDEWKKYLKPTELSAFRIIPLVNGEGTEESAEGNFSLPADSSDPRRTDEMACGSGKGDRGGLPEDEAEKKPIYILPGMAFGTGVHETTRLCVEMLTKYVESGDIVADIGTGSGVLAIAAEKLGAAQVYAVDNDPVALDNTRTNAELNHSGIHIRCGDLAHDLSGTFDVVVANIVVKAVIELADMAKALLRAEGVYLCSGIIQEEKQNVVSALELKGYRVLEVMDMGEWCAVAAAPSSRRFL